MTLVKCVCQHCGKDFERPLKRVYDGRGKYCSRSCSSSGTGTKRVGPLNPAWRGGISKEHSRYKNLFRQRHPEKALAHDAVRRAIEARRLIPGPCAHCGCTKRIHGHHTDYSKPLQVIWLCKPCHIQEHVRLSREALQEVA